MRHTLEDIRAEYDRLDGICGIDTSRVKLRISKGTRRLGSFSYDRFDPYNTMKIAVSSVTLEDDDLFYHTVRHEYAHCAVFLLRRGENHGHDAIFRAMCRKIGCSTEATVRPDSETGKKLSAMSKYTVRCRQCGAETGYNSAGKTLKLIMSGKKNAVFCRRCRGSDFEVIINR